MDMWRFVFTSISLFQTKQTSFSGSIGTDAYLFQLFECSSTWGGCNY